MTIYTDRIVLVFAIEAKGRAAAASLQTLEITESGREFETLVPLDPTKVKDYAAEFNLGFEAEKAKLQATIAELQAKVAHLESIKSFDDSLISIDAFLARVQPEMFWLMAEAQIDETSNAILKMLLAKKGTKETPLSIPVNLKSPNLINALGYLVGRGKLTPERVSEITQPASRDEAYDAD